MSVVTESSVMEERFRLRRPRNHCSQPISEPDPNPSVQSTSETQSTRGKSTISSLFLSTFSNASNEILSTSINISKKKKNNFSSGTFKGLGCAASGSQQVLVPAVSRTSADLQTRKMKKKLNKYPKKTRQEISEGSTFISNSSFHSTSCIDVQDVWCGPGIGFSADAADSVDCVVARRSLHRRGTIGGVLTSQRERPCLTRRALNSEIFSFIDSDSEITATSHQSDVFETTEARNVENPCPARIIELLSLRSRLLMHGRSNVPDQFRDLRLDIDNMSYEELLELGDTIGYVNTGLQEDEISRCLRKAKTINNAHDFSSIFSVIQDRKCSICQEEYEADDETGKLECGHSYHVECIKQWLARKNACPVCKIAPMDRH